MGFFNQITMNLLGTTQAISILKDPFSASRVTEVNIFMRKSNWGEGERVRWSGSIDFQNGNTKGSQDFEVMGADGLPTIVKQMDEFIKSLK